MQPFPTFISFYPEMPREPYQPTVWPNDFPQGIPWRSRFPESAGKLAAWPAQFESTIISGSPPFPFVVADKIRFKFARFQGGLYQWEETQVFAHPNIQTTLVSQVVRFQGGFPSVFWNFVFQQRNPFTMEARRIGFGLGPVAPFPPWPQHFPFTLELLFRGSSQPDMKIRLDPKNGYYGRDCPSWD